MFKIAALVVMVCGLWSCRTTTYYIVRHAEKEPAIMMSSDVPLSAAGHRRADALKDLLQDRHIRAIYSTNFQRTLSTVLPLSQATGVPVQRYDAADSGFAQRLRAAEGNVVVVGHSNTVDDLIHALTGTDFLSGDLADNQYGDLFVVQKKGSRFRMESKRYGP